ncbi:hydroxymethylbilane synthase [Chitinophaga sp. GCM10012297]|uniref:Hydroxymethylbilane synthase n=1 Tax=Chitinophaga chungangae TaxID=2821488 RepID=A0ABS3Y949_9BACT|nr:hydroxymethylbilane synthase [Chitinophaga chungangae]MBO9151166.1 hydroxymethylbilane synthase [Chitinophaga chungangae]
MDKVIRIGTRESQLALWQANLVKDLLTANGHSAELVPIKSDGDIDLITPLYEIGVQGIFTKSLDAAMLANRIDIAVHSFKDVPTQLPKGLMNAAVIERGNVKDLLVYKNDTDFLNDTAYTANIATSSIRRKAQWLRRYPQHQLHNLRGNVNTRLQKLASENWDAAIFAAAGLERINVRPANSVILNWMLPAPAQGAIVVACRENDGFCREALAPLNHTETALCTSIERAFLRTLLGGCTTPISAYAYVSDGRVVFEGNLCSLNGDRSITVTRQAPVETAGGIGKDAAEEVLAKGGDIIIEAIRNAQA